MSIPPKAYEAAQLIDRLERLARHGEHERGLNPAQWDALRYLARANRFSRTPAALADFLASTRGTVSRTLASLEDKGLVAREPSASDGRSIALSLTAQGRQTIRRDPLRTMADDIERALGSDVDDLVEGLRRMLRQVIGRNRGRAFGACSDCRHFRRDALPASAQPHRCALLDEALSDADSQAICVEQESIT